MPFFSGFAGEFGRQLERSRADEADRAERQNALESSILQHLATSTDPEVASHAITGLLDLAGPQKKASGLSGWLGKQAVHPALPTIRQLVAAGRPVTTPGTPSQVPSLQGQSGVEALPGEVHHGPNVSGAALDALATPPSTGADRRPAAPTAAVAPPAPASSSPTSPMAQSQSARRAALGVGSQPPAASPAAAALPPPAGPPMGSGAPSTQPAFAAGGDRFTPGTAPTTQTVPRQLFRTPDEQAALTSEATRGGVLTADIKALRGTSTTGPLSPEESRAIFGHVPSSALIPAGTAQGKMYPAGTLDNSGRPLSPEQYYTSRADPLDPSRTVQFPVATPTSVSNQAAISARPTFQHYVGPDGKTPGVWRVARDGSKAPEFVGYSGAKGTYLQYVDPDTQEMSYIAAPAVYTAGAELPAVPQAPAAGGAAGGPAGGATGAPPAPGQAAAPTAAPATPAGPAATSPAATAPPSIAGGRKLSYEQVQGAYISPTTGEPVIGTALFDKPLGRYFSAQDPSQEAAGFIPGPEGAYAVTAYHQANATLITMHAAMKAIEDAGLATNNKPEATTRLMAKFYSGTTGGNPIDAAFASLTNLAGLQGATQYIRSNSRSYQMFQQALMHLPRAPSEANAQRSRVPGVGRLINPGTVGAFGGHGWDSPASMYQKLKQAESIIQQGKGSLQELTGKTPDRAIGAGGAGAGGSGGAGGAGASGAAQAPPAPVGRGAGPAAGPASSATPAASPATPARTGPAIGEERTLQTAAGPVQAVWDGRGWRPK